MKKPQLLRAVFLGSYPTVNDMPQAPQPEYAFIGRSNVGKSSLINRLLHRRKLAKTSSTPGKTTLLNCFEVDKSWRIVDMPGYGWARKSQKERARMERENKRYLTQRRFLVCVFVLMDGRVPLQPADEAMMGWLEERIIPFAGILTKMDALNRRKKEAQMHHFRSTLQARWSPAPLLFTTSSVSGEGREKLLDFMNHTRQEWTEAGLSRKDA